MNWLALNHLTIIFFLFFSSSQSTSIVTVSAQKPFLVTRQMFLEQQLIKRDMFPMQALAFHCFYHYFSHQTFMVQIDDLMKMLIFNWFYHHYWIVQHFDCMSFLSLGLAVPHGAPMSPQDAPRPPNDSSRHPQGPPMTTQGRPKVVIF